MLVELAVERLLVGKIYPVELEAEFERELWQNLDSGLVETDRRPVAREVIALQHTETPRVGTLGAEVVAQLYVPEGIAADGDRRSGNLCVFEQILVAVVECGAELIAVFELDPEARLTLAALQGTGPFPRIDPPIDLLDIPEAPLEGQLTDPCDRRRTGAESAGERALPEPLAPYEPDLRIEVVTNQEMLGLSPPLVSAVSEAGPIALVATREGPGR